LSPPVHNPFFHVGFIVPDLDAAMEEFQVALGIEWRAPIDAIVPLLGPDGVVEADVYSVYREGGPRSSLSSRSPEPRSPATVV